ncbi:MAG: MarR family winged helix-turn-helix transcriptional regulator [Sphingomonadaceae bacterium]
MKKIALKKGALEASVGFHVTLAKLTTDQLFQSSIGERFSLRPVEYTLLVLLQENSSLTPKQLSSSLALSGPLLTQLLDRVQERGWISRERNEQDGRSQKVALTPAGVKLAKSLIATPPDADLERCLSAAERAMLVELLGKVAAHRLAGEAPPKAEPKR